MADVFPPEQRRWIMGRVRGRDTKPELRVRSWLHRNGFRFRLHRRDLPGTPDIVLPGRRTVIFVHGCFWHRHPGCKFASHPATNTEFWAKKFEGTVRRDQESQVALQALGWKVIVIWQCELRNEEELWRRLACCLKEAEHDTAG